MSIQCDIEDNCIYYTKYSEYLEVGDRVCSSNSQAIELLYYEIKLCEKLHTWNLFDYLLKVKYFRYNITDSKKSWMQPSSTSRYSYL